MSAKVKKKNKKIQNQNIEKEQEDADKIRKIKIKVIGLGGGGGAIVSDIALQISKASFAVANTDIQALKIVSKNVERFQLGQNLTQGLGTGMRVDLGRMAAQNEKEKIKKLCQGYDLCIIIACLGGGTGSGAAPVFAKISKELGNITYGIFTLPFKFEGEKKMEIAKESLKKAKGYLDAITFIPNERIFQTIDKSTPLKQALSIINKRLSKTLEGLIETIYEPGLINIDFADFRTIFQGSKEKLTYLDSVEILGKDKDSVKGLISQALISPLYPYSIKGAKAVLFNIIGEKNLSLSEVEQISKNISELVSPEAKIIFGVSYKKKYPDNAIKTTLLAVGCGGGGAKEVIKKEKKTINKSKPNQKRIKKIKPIKPLLPPKADTSKANQNQENQEIIRKNGLQIKREVQELEKEILESEKFWEAPAFLRRKSTKLDL